MSILKDELATLFMSYPRLKAEYDNIDIIKMDNIMISYFKNIITSNNDYVNPYSLSKELNFSSTQTITLLLLLTLYSKNEIISAEYIFECDCGLEHYVTEEQLEEFKCLECEETHNIKNDLQDGIYTLPIRFKLSKSFIDGIKLLFSPKKKEGADIVNVSRNILSEVGKEVVDSKTKSGIKSRQPTLANLLQPKSGITSILDFKIKQLSSKNL